jgi:mRNA interferase MazF
MKRGEVWWVNFDPSVGGEIRKKRPAVIVSNDSANRALNRVQVVPLSTQVDKLYPSEAYVTVAGRKNKAMADQLATVSKQRLTSKLGAVSREDLSNIEAAIRIQLDLA